MSKAFASQADLSDKKITFEQLSAHCWAYTAEGDPNSGVIIGEKFIMVSDATATPAMAQDLIAKIRTVSDKPIKYVLLTHYHAVRVLGASAYAAEGATDPGLDAAGRCPATRSSTGGGVSTVEEQAANPNTPALSNTAQRRWELILRNAMVNEIQSFQAGF